MSDSSGNDSDISRYLDFSDSENKSEKNGSNSSKKKADKTFKVKKEHTSSKLKQKESSSPLENSGGTQTHKPLGRSRHKHNDTSSSSSSKRTRFNKSSSSLDDPDDSRAEDLEFDQQKYPPQHKPGDPQDFNADQKRIDYFKEVLAVKLNKYQDLNSFRPNSPSRHTPLALTLLGFCQHYWPGKVVCCGLLREDVMALEKHINRMHRSPDQKPNMLIIPKKKKKSRRDWDDFDGDNSQCSSDASGSESSDSVKPLSVRVDRSGSSNSNTKVVSKSVKVERLQQNRVSTSPPPKVSENSIVARRPGPKSKTSLLVELEEDQLKYPPQHKPEESDDFNSNETSLNYFRDVFQLKQTKYSKMPIVKNSPLSYSMSHFVNHYWPGCITCCHLVHSNCKDFSEHLTAAHSSGQPLRLTTAPLSTPLTTDDLDSFLLADDDPPRPLSPVSKLPSPARTKTSSSTTSSLRSIRPLPVTVVDLTTIPAKPGAKTVMSKSLKSNGYGYRPKSPVRSVIDLWSSSSAVPNVSRERGTSKEPQNKRRRSKSPTRSVANRSSSPPSPSSSNVRSPPPPPFNSRRMTRNTHSNNNNLKNLKSPTPSKSRTSSSPDFPLSPLLPDLPSPPAGTSNRHLSQSQFPSPPDLWPTGIDPFDTSSAATSSAFSTINFPSFEPTPTGSFGVMSNTVEHSSSGKTSQQQKQQQDDPSTSLFCNALCSMLSQLQPRERERIKRNIYNLVSDAILMELPN